MRKTNKLFVALLLFGLLTSGCSLMPTAGSRRSKKSSEESQEVVDNFDAKTHEIYELYLANGGTLTYEEWLESIKGEKGDKGDKGDTGATGATGQQGPKGDKGDKGDQGDPGQDGKDGVDGQDGADGTTPHIGNKGNWWIGDVDTGVLAGGQNGQDGVSIVSTVINSEGELIITFSDGTTQNVGKLTFTEHVHEYESNVVNPTCTTDGYVTFTCKTCGHIETVINKATGHEFEAWRESIAATCYSDGLKVRYCVKCGEKQQETIPMHEHTASTTCIHNSATHWYFCTECGVALNEQNHNYVGNTCSTCGYVLKEASADDGMIYSLNSDGESYTLADLGTCKELDIAIPEFYNGKPITAIGQGAFGNSNITSITMTDNIASIGAGCFKDCKELLSVVLSTKITRIENGTFNNCSKLTAVSIPNGVTYIGQAAFYSSGIISMSIPDSVTFVGHQAFCYCPNLKRIVLSSAIENIDSYAFAWNYSLEEVIIPEGCKRLSTCCFENNNMIQSIYIPASMISIGSQCFRGCSGLVTATFGDPDNWYVGSTLIPKEALQDEEVAARKIFALVESTWEHRVSN